MTKELKLKYHKLPPSVNNYLKPNAMIKGGKAIVVMYETKEAKEFKKWFKRYVKQEVEEQGWDIEQTKEGHWYLDCIFYQARTNMDNNNFYKILCDSLSGIATDDDKNVLVRTQEVYYDSKNPRMEMVLRRVEYIGIFANDEQLQEFKSKCEGCSRFKRNCSIFRKALEGRIQEEIQDMKCSKFKGVK